MTEHPGVVVFAVRKLGMSAGLIGVVFSVASTSALLGAVLSSRLPKWIGVGPAIVASAFVASLAALVLPLATRSTAVPLLITFGLVGSFANVIYNVTQVSLRQAITPERLQGRMNATMRFMVWGTIPIGSLVGGALGDAIGLRATLWVGALGGLTAVLPVLFSRVRTLRSVPEIEAELSPLEPEVRTRSASVTTEG